MKCRAEKCEARIPPCFAEQSRLPMNLSNILNYLLSPFKGHPAQPVDCVPSALWYDNDDLHARTTVTRNQITREEAIAITLPDEKRAVMKLSRMMKSGYSIRAPLAEINGDQGYLYVHIEIESSYV
jgi:hypothetical protein